MVAGLVVAIGVISGDDLLAGGGAALDEVAPGAEGEDGDAALGEGVMIGAIIPAGFGVGLGRDPKVVGLGDAGEVVLKRGAADADELDVACGGKNDVRVEVNDGGEAGERGAGARRNTRSPSGLSLPRPRRRKGRCGRTPGRS